MIWRGRCSDCFRAMPRAYGGLNHDKLNDKSRQKADLNKLQSWLLVCGFDGSMKIRHQILHTRCIDAASEGVHWHSASVGRSLRANIE